ncbi:MAG TPA: ATP-binding protein [Tenuifilaceae bacterium]|nr:ATP-binding protein [Tenuifilaceae bacterium]HPE17715.1 ATP-binding protein [Tenuifilaceae bacterium]HPQ33407.1 ATP-binding protein [Tenuifilaceae bacterium]HRX66953.1 ATP-binding protein [Tenuifilaceae bacterium]
METLNVLVVDDEFGIRSGVSRILRNFSISYPFMDEDIEFNVIEAATGEEALEAIKKNPPAVVLLDNKLPGIQGIEVLEYINNNSLDILVVMITSYASLELAVKATNIGAYDFVPKPFTPQELKSSMENVAKHYFLRRMTRKLHKEGKQVRFQFLTVLSHEMKAPLNSIEGYLKIMQEKQAGEKIDDYEKMIDRSLARIKAMRTLIMDLLDLTRIESGKKKRELREIDLSLVIKSAIETMMPMAIQRDVTFEFNNIVPANFMADSEEMEIVFNNLVSNAVKYNTDGGKVVCSVEKNSSEIIIVISDTGVGIATEDLPKLFHEFSRIKNPCTKDIAGSGLGLSIVKRIINMYMGQIDVKSTPGVGSSFTITLPVLPTVNQITGL